jgi:hypothetical protein
MAGPGRAIHGEARPTRALLGHGNAEISTIQLEAIELLDGRRSRRLLFELDERKPSRTTGITVAGQKHFYQLAHLGEQGLELHL